MRGLLMVLLVLWAGLVAAAEAPAPPPSFVGSETCARCHRAEAGRWHGSDHALAWTPPDAAHVLGDFNDTTFESDAISARFFRKDGRFWIEAEDGNGQRRAFEVLGVAGVRPLQQYLISPEAGRTQAFDVAWDTERRVWYDLYPDTARPAGDGLHWTGPYKSWEARCAECHATDYHRNYAPPTRTYAPTMAEIGVGCEACHGPGAAHVDWVRHRGTAVAAGLTPQGFTADLSTAEGQIQQCAGCHSRRESLIDGDPLPGTPYHDSFTLALLRDGVYHADGQIEAEDYEYGSFLQSRMYAHGVRCSDCHDPHSLQLRADGNAVCTQCHSPAGNDRFPTLRKALYDDPSHHFHEPGTPGASCPACHMPQQVYMGVDARRDHGFRVPRPDLSAETGDPDTCAACHADKGPDWAAAEIAKRYPDSTHRGPTFATTFAQARWAPAQQADALLAIATNPEAAGIVRASALDLLAPVSDAGIATRAAPLLADPDPLVRAAAAGVQRPLDADARAARLLPVLGDPLRTVRIAAAKAMLGPPPTAAPPATMTALAAATGEWQASEKTRLDFPETHLQIAGAALANRNFAIADAAFREAVSLDPQLVDGWVMIVRLHAALGDAPGAAAALTEAEAANPGNEVLAQLRSQLGP